MSIIGLYEGSKSIEVAREGVSRFFRRPKRCSRRTLFLWGCRTPNSRRYEKDIKAVSDQGKNAVVLTRFRDPFQDRDSAKDVDVILVAPKGPGAHWCAVSSPKAKACPR